MSPDILAKSLGLHRWTDIAMSHDTSYSGEKSGDITSSFLRGKTISNLTFREIGTSIQSKKLLNYCNGYSQSTSSNLWSESTYFFTKLSAAGIVHLFCGLVHVG